MTPRWRNVLITMSMALIAGVSGVWLGMTFFGQSHRPTLHEVIHRELSITAAQDRKIEALETTFATRRQALEREMRASNAELAAAIREEQGYGPKVTAAVEHVHDAMGRMQTESIAHVFAMREVLTPEQRTKFDETVVTALTNDGQ